MNEKDKVVVNSELENLLDDRDVFVTYLLCDMPEGISLKEVSEVLGNPGIEALETLVAKGIVKQQPSNRYKLSSSGILIRSFGSIKRHLKTYTSHYKTQHVGKGRNYVHSLTSGTKPWWNK